MKSGRNQTHRRTPLVCVALLAAAFAGGLGGCASQQGLDQAHDANRTLTERNAELQRQVQELQAENQLLQRGRSSSDAAVTDLQNTNARLQAELDAAMRAMRDLEARLNSVALAPLDPETDRALAELASRYPDLIQYDPARGMLRFASDLTFASGSDQVQQGAMQSLQALAQILNTTAAAPYEVVIVGHTDSQRISANTAQRHPTNMHLSAHRAISVRRALMGMGVPAGKMMAAGWGEERPAVPNTASGNTPQNRRVEIFLTRSTAGQAGTTATQAAPADVAPDRQTPPDRQPDMSK